MKTIMILGAGEMQVPVILRAQELGVDTLIVDRDADAPGFQYGGTHAIISTNDTKQILALGIEHSIDAVMTTSDLPVRVVAEVCLRLGLNGVSVNVAEVCTNKFLQRQLFQENDIKSPKYQLVRSVSDIKESYNFPVIVKPVDSSASRGVKRVNNKGELLAQIPISAKYSTTGDVLVEEFIEGREFSVETLTQNNITAVIAITEKVIQGEEFGCFVEDRHIIPARVTQDEYKLICNTVKLAIQAISLDNSPTHTEVKINENGVYIIEVACRLGGDFITSHLVPLATGVDMLGNLIRLSLGEKIDIYKTKSDVAFVQFINAENYERCFNYIEDDEHLIIKSELKPFHSRPIENSIDRMGYVIIRVNNFAEMDKHLKSMNGY